MKIGEIKKCFSLLPAAVLILSMFSCSSDDDNNDMHPDMRPRAVTLVTRSVSRSTFINRSLVIY